MWSPPRSKKTQGFWGRRSGAAGREPDPGREAPRRPPESSGLPWTLCPSLNSSGSPGLIENTLAPPELPVAPLLLLCGNLGCNPKTLIGNILGGMLPVLARGWEKKEKGEELHNVEFRTPEQQFKDKPPPQSPLVRGVAQGIEGQAKPNTMKP